MYIGSMKSDLLKSKFIKNSFTLISGSIVAQLLPMALRPVITRLYSPENIAVWGLYISLVNILVSVASGSFEMSIILPKQKEDAINLCSLTLIIPSIFCLILLAIAIIFNSNITSYLN